jgi:hypothetical protein
VIVHDPAAKLPHIANPWLVICAQLLAEHAVSGVFAKFQETAKGVTVIGGSVKVPVATNCT